VLLQNNNNNNNNNNNKKKKKKKKKKMMMMILAVWQLSGSVLSRRFLVPLGVLFVMKTLKDER